MQSKQTHRKALRRLRRGLSERARREAEARIFQNLEVLRAAEGARRVGVYAAVGSEVSVWRWAEHVYRTTGRCAWPIVTQDALHFCWSSPTNLKAGFRGIREPDHEAQRAEVTTLDILVVPGLGFGSRGARLGQGGGFYDRALASGRPTLVVGVCFEAQLREDIPMSEHDQPVDYLVTESRTVCCRP